VSDLLTECRSPDCLAPWSVSPTLVPFCGISESDRISWCIFCAETDTHRGRDFTMAEWVGVTGGDFTLKCEMARQTGCILAQ